MTIVIVFNTTKLHFNTTKLHFNTTKLHLFTRIKSHLTGKIQLSPDTVDMILRMQYTYLIDSKN